MREKNDDDSHLWYVGYGSNLCRERFLAYVKGGKFRLGGKPCSGCCDMTFLDESKPFKIPHGLFFAKCAPGWECGGVAFISLKSEPDQSGHTYGRMWKITRKQFSDVWAQEGKGWYDRKLLLGTGDDGMPIITITCGSESPSSTPSANYLKTMVMGLGETYQLSDEAILQYLIEKPGIRHNMTKTGLLEIIRSA